VLLPTLTALADDADDDVVGGVIAATLQLLQPALRRLCVRGSLWTAKTAAMWTTLQQLQQLVGAHTHHTHEHVRCLAFRFHAHVALTLTTDDTGGGGNGRNDDDESAFSLSAVPSDNPELSVAALRSDAAAAFQHLGRWCDCSRHVHLYSLL
jgi:hypothetical protein